MRRRAQQVNPCPATTTRMRGEVKEENGCGRNRRRTESESGEGEKEGGFDLRQWPIRSICRRSRRKGDENRGGEGRMPSVSIAPRTRTRQLMKPLLKQTPGFTIIFVHGVKFRPTGFSYTNGWTTWTYTPLDSWVAAHSVRGLPAPAHPNHPFTSPDLLISTRSRSRAARGIERGPSQGGESGRQIQ